MRPDPEAARIDALQRIVIAEAEVTQARQALDRLPRFSLSAAARRRRLDAEQQLEYKLAEHRRHLNGYRILTDWKR